MRSKDSATESRREAVGMALGFLGVVIFSMTFPATRAAVGAFGGVAVGIGRSVLAGMLALLVLRVKRVPIPDTSMRSQLFRVAIGVVLGFPLLTALALRFVPASRGAIVIGILPAATALLAALRHKERPSWQFWLAASGGLATVVVFSVITGANGRPEPADGLLLLAVGAAAYGYTEGASVSAELGGWQTISWVMVLSLPFTVVVTTVAVLINGIGEPTLGALLGFAYVGVFSAYVGFFAWYAGLNMGGTARVSQMQLLQPVLTLGWAALLLGEEITRAALVAALLVLVFVVATRKASIYRG